MPAYLENLEIVTRYMLSSEECKQLVKFKLNIHDKGITNVEYYEKPKEYVQTQLELQLDS